MIKGIDNKNSNTYMSTHCFITKFNGERCSYPGLESFRDVITFVS